jgi:UDP-N-acetylmuramyl pentapeptide synthase
LFLTNLINKDIRLSKSIEDNPIITGLDFDSRKIKKGMMFAAINGENNNGIDFCDKALKAGATTILCSKKEINKIINNLLNNLK